MKLRQIVISIIAASPLVASAGALDRTGQQITELFERGNYASVSYAYAMPQLSGKHIDGVETKNMLKNFSKVGAAIKFGAGENGNTAFLLKYDQPWGVDTLYKAGYLNGTIAEINSDSVTAVVGYRTPSNLWLYGGLDFQQSSGEVVIKIPNAVAKASVVGGFNAKLPAGTPDANKLSVAKVDGLAAKVAGGVASAAEIAQNTALQRQIAGAQNYTLDIENKNSIAYIGGLAYAVPKLALRADLTYRSAAQYHSNITEFGTQKSVMRFKYPQSVNFNFQTGIMPKTLLMTSFRWVNWKKFETSPTLYVQTRGKPLASYSKDQYSGSIAIGRQLTKRLSAKVGVEYDTGTGEPYSALGPYKDKKAVFVGGKLKVNDMMDIAAGVNYTMLGDGEMNKGKSILEANFADNSAIGVGVKAGFRF